MMFVQILDLLKENAALEPIDVTVRLVRLYLNRPNSQEEKVTVLRSFSNLLISQCRSQVDYAIIWIQLSYEIFASMGTIIGSHASLVFIYQPLFQVTRMSWWTLWHLRNISADYIQKIPTLNTFWLHYIHV